MDGKSSANARRTETCTVGTSGPDMTVTSLVDRLIEDIRVPFDSSDAFLGWLEIEQLVP